MLFTVVKVARMEYHAPISSARSATGRLKLWMKFDASRRTSTMLLIKANTGASGNAATNIVTKPY